MIPDKNEKLHLQAQELRIYFKSLGAEISEEKSQKGIEDDLHKIIGVCDACFKEGNESEVETILNDIVSIMILVSKTINYNLLILLSKFFKLLKFSVYNIFVGIAYRSG